MAERKRALSNYLEALDQLSCVQQQRLCIKAARSVSCANSAQLLFNALVPRRCVQCRTMPDLRAVLEDFLGIHAAVVTLSTRSCIDNML